MTPPRKFAHTSAFIPFVPIYRVTGISGVLSGRTQTSLTGMIAPISKTALRHRAALTFLTYSAFVNPGAGQSGLPCAEQCKTAKRIRSLAKLRLSLTSALCKQSSPERPYTFLNMLSAYTFSLGRKATMDAHAID